MLVGEDFVSPPVSLPHHGLDSPVGEKVQDVQREVANTILILGTVG